MVVTAACFFVLTSLVWIFQAKKRAMSRLHSIMDWFAGAKGGLDAAALDSKMAGLEWVEKEMKRGGHVIQKVLIPSSHLKAHLPPITLAETPRPHPQPAVQFTGGLGFA